MPDRAIAPTYRPIGTIEFTDPSVFKLQNGIEVFCFDLADEEVIKIEIITEGGKWNESKLGVASLAAKLVKEGTQKLTAVEFANAVDFYGGTFQSTAGLHTAVFTLFSLNKYLPELLPLMKEALTDAAFREDDLQLAVGQSLQKLAINLEKVEYCGQRAFLNQLFGDNHPYGSLANADTYRAITRADLKDHAQNFLTSNAKIIVSGKIPAGFNLLLNDTLGTLKLHADLELKEHVLQPFLSQKHNDDWPKAQQSAIRVGRQIVNRNHPDFHALQVFNTALGGYFGSRLMKNIREDKGYTYGIYSSLVSMPQAAYFHISTEVGKQFREETIKEIHHELKRLQTDLMSEQELSMVKNNMLGNILEGIDGPFNLASTYKSLLPYNLDFGYFYDFIKVIKTITPPDIQRLASQYFDPAEMTEIVVG